MLEAYVYADQLITRGQLPPATARIKARLTTLEYELTPAPETTAAALAPLLQGGPGEVRTRWPRWISVSSRPLCGPCGPYG